MKDSKISNRIINSLLPSLVIYGIFFVFQQSMIQLGMLIGVATALLVLALIDFSDLELSIGSKELESNKKREAL